MVSALSFIIPHRRCTLQCVSRRRENSRNNNGKGAFDGLDKDDLAVEVAAENMAAFAEIAKKVQMDTVELMMAAGKDMSEDATAAVKKATAEVTAAAKKATAAAK